MCDPRQRLEQITTTTTKVSKCDGWTRLHVPRAVRDRSKFAERDVQLSSTKKLQLLAHLSRRNGDHPYTGESAQSIGILIDFVHSAPFLSLRNFHKAINSVSGLRLTGIVSLWTLTSRLLMLIVTLYCTSEQDTVEEERLHR
eukprot:TRINITY_DN1124_c0_g1_i4.p1 TRINITY_DN1124_c0_g1~~TRINITY_DN1124_c0_g1_i4.p1  ORF type:complete len:142 (-),score=13.97 TRINITY_DN1124_c0_g1_i4:172-597(-)